MNTTGILILAGALLLLGVVARRIGGGIASSAEIAAHLAEDAVIVDCRTPGEFDVGHAARAINIPVDEIRARSAELGAPDRPIILYCATGSRSSIARGALRRAGFQRVINAGTAERLERARGAT